MRIGTKLFIAFAALGVAAIAVTGGIAYRSAKSSLELATYERLTALREAKRRQIEGYFRDLSGTVSTLAIAPLVRDSLREFSAAVESMSPSNPDDLRSQVRMHYADELSVKLLSDRDGVLDVDELLPRDAVAWELQRRYLVENPNPTGAKEELDDAGTNDAYDRAHAQHHPLLRHVQRTYGFYDVFIVDVRSLRVVYTVFKEIDFGTKLRDGPFEDSGLARAAESALSSSSSDDVTLVDFEHYAPSYHAPAAFLAAPIMLDDDVAGALVVQVPVDRVNAIMTGERNWRSDGLGDSGETYIVGENLFMRSDSRFLIEAPDRFFRKLASNGMNRDDIERMRSLETTILLQRVDSEASRAAAAGERDTRIVLDYRNIPVLSSFCPLVIPDVRWSLLSEIDEAEAFAPIRALRAGMIRLASIVAILFGLIGWFFARTITRPITILTREARALGHGDLSRRVTSLARDEIGLLGQTFNHMAGDLQRTTVSKAFVDDILASMTNLLLVTEPCDGLLDASTRIRSTNRAACKMIGREESALEGVVLGDVFPDLPAPGEGWFGELATHGSIEGVETEMTGADGVHTPVLLAAAVLRGAREATGGIVLVAQDITARKAAEAATRDRDRLQRDLDIASKIQSGLLPRETPTLPGYDVEGWSRPADSTGGDYYDWQPLPDGRLAVTIADVTGHGIGPALVTAVCRAYSRVGVASGETMQTLMKHINELLVEDLPAERFVTFAMVQIDAAKNRVSVLSAGHAPWIRYSAQTGSLYCNDAHNIPFGIMDNIDYGTPDEIELDPGDMIVLVTDGFFEWMNTAGEQFGIKRLSQAIRDQAGGTALEVIHGILKALEDFVGEVAQPDDLTAVVIRRLPVEEPNRHSIDPDKP